MEKNFILQPGDMVFSSGKGILSNLLRVIQAVREDTLLGDILGHVEIAIKKMILFSAEGKGMSEIPWEERVKKSRRLEVYRFKKKLNVGLLRIYADQQRGAGYAYSRWILNAVIIICFFMTLISLVGLIFSLTFAGVMAGISLILFFPVRDWLKKNDKITFDCSGSFSQILTNMKRIISRGRPRDDTPNTLYQVIKNLELQGLVERVY